MDDDHWMQDALVSESIKSHIRQRNCGPNLLGYADSVSKKCRAVSVGRRWFRQPGKLPTIL